MGDFDIFFSMVSMVLLSFVIYNLLNSFSFSNLMRRFGLLKTTSRDFYECGFSPTTQKPISLPMPFLLICIFFLLYDMELMFLFPLVSTVSFFGLLDFMLVVFFFFMLLMSLIFDFNSHALMWQY